MQAIGSLVKLFNEWEIQLLVLLSFTLQLFLFFAGSLRRRSTNGFLRFSNWMAYLGADFVAVYALGYLSRHDQEETREIKPLAFFWAPFLLIHLGGQDTITSFSMEDNKLWLRHLLNLVVQVVLALYVFWKSIGRLHNAELLVSGALVFVAGIIKYVERIWCLKRGTLEGLESTRWSMTRRDTDIDVDPGGYARTLLQALGSMRYVIGIFSSTDLGVGGASRQEESIEMVKVVRLHLGLMYDELYTKALVLRTRSWMIFRHMSQICVVVAFVLFHVIVDKKRRYLKADVAITYSLFIGCFFIEVCSVINSMMSPWTWKMLRDRKWERLARLSWFIFSSDIGCPEKKQWWPCSFGQYNFVSWLTKSDQQPRKTVGQWVMVVVRRVLVDLAGVKEDKIFWMSKALDPWYIDADNIIMEQYVAEEIKLLARDYDGCSPSREWPNLGSALESFQTDLETNFGGAIVHMHVLTELHLRRYSDMAAADGVAQVCRKLSNYMMYLLVIHPSMLPLTISSVRVLESYYPYQMGNMESIEKSLHGILLCMVPHTVGWERVLESWQPFEMTTIESTENDLHRRKETMEEMVHMWTRLLLYAAGKSRPELQAAQLTSSGGELITLAWLLMAIYLFGDSDHRRFRIIKRPDSDMSREVYAFNIIASTNQHAAGIKNSPNLEEAYDALYEQYQQKLQEYIAAVNAHEEYQNALNAGFLAFMQTGAPMPQLGPPPPPKPPLPNMPSRSEFFAHAATWTPGSAHSGAFFSGAASGRGSASPGESPPVTPLWLGGRGPGASASPRRSPRDSPIQ